MKLVTFRIHEELYALPVDAVLSIERLEPIRPVPMAPESIVGIMNLRGVVITVADLRETLGRPATPETPETRLLVVGQTAYIVDETLDVLDVEPTAIELQDSTSSLIAGVLQQDGQLIAILNETHLASIA